MKCINNAMKLNALVLIIVLAAACMPANKPSQTGTEGVETSEVAGATVSSCVAAKNQISGKAIGCPQRVLAKITAITPSWPDGLTLTEEHLYANDEYRVWIGDTELGQEQCYCRASCDISDKACQFTLSPETCAACSIPLDGIVYQFSLPYEGYCKSAKVPASKGNLYQAIPKGAPDGCYCDVTCSGNVCETCYTDKQCHGCGDSGLDGSCERFPESRCNAESCISCNGLTEQECSSAAYCAWKESTCKASPCKNGQFAALPASVKVPCLDLDGKSSQSTATIYLENGAPMGGYLLSTQTKGACIISTFSLYTTGYLCVPDDFPQEPPLHPPTQPLPPDNPEENPPITAAAVTTVNVNGNQITIPLLTIAIDQCSGESYTASGENDPEADCLNAAVRNEDLASSPNECSKSDSEASGAVCGNGIVEGTEVCDDADSDASDGCDGCRKSTCNKKCYSSDKSNNICCGENEICASSEYGGGYGKSKAWCIPKQEQLNNTICPKDATRCTSGNKGDGVACCPVGWSCKKFEGAAWCSPDNAESCKPPKTLFCSKNNKGGRKDNACCYPNQVCTEAYDYSWCSTPKKSCESKGAGYKSCGNYCCTSDQICQENGWAPDSCTWRDDKNCPQEKQKCFGTSNDYPIVICCNIGACMQALNGPPICADNVYYP